MKRENANIDADTAMGTMLKYGSESAKQFYEMCVIDPKYARAHREGDIHIHDMDFYTLTTTCCQIELRQAVQGRLLHRPRRAARAQRHRQLCGARLHRHPVEPERPARRPVASCDFDYGLADGRAQDVPPPVQEASCRSPRPADRHGRPREAARKPCSRASRRRRAYGRQPGMDGSPGRCRELPWRTRALDRAPLACEPQALRPTTASHLAYAEKNAHGRHRPRDVSRPWRRLCTT